MAIDVGNTRLKVGLFSEDKLLNVLVDPELSELGQIAQDSQVSNVIACSVATHPDEFETETGLSPIVWLRPTLRIPIRNQYASPETLGMDRLAVVVGAHHLFPDANCLVIDAGTTITYDFIIKSGEYLGGGISPGIRLRFKALNQHTDRLPEITKASDLPVLIGDSTESSILSGVLNGVLAEIDGIIRRYEHKFSTLRVIMCGGDSSYLQDKVRSSVEVEPHLVLAGLNSILLYHAHES